MTFRRLLPASAALAAFALAAAAARAAEVTLSSMFGDGMVLQRDVECPMWGRAAPDVAVVARIAGKDVASATADSAGAFKLKLPKLAAPGPYEIDVRCADGSGKTLHDVLAGDVWLCGGQSNMQWRVIDSIGGKEAAADATAHPTIRLFYVPRVASGVPLGQVDAHWMPCTPETVGEFSAVGYFFGRDLSAKLNVPIGLIHSSYGGTPAESWLPIDSLRSLTDQPRVQKTLARADADNRPGAIEDFERRTRQWLDATGRADTGIADAAKDWAGVDLVDEGWKPTPVPGDVSRQGVPNDSIFWLRRHFTLPAEAAGKLLTLELSVVDDFDQTFVDGVVVGHTGVETPEWWNKPRRYAIPADVARAGDNVIAIRIQDLDGRAGLVGNAGQIRVTIPTPSGAPARVVQLAGEWRSAIERAGAGRPPAGDAERPARPESLLRPDNPQFPGGLYNGMIAPIGDAAIRGAIWYQGEANVDRPGEYLPVMRTLIADWRKQFGGDFPFYIVGLANHHAASTQPSQTSEWGGLREAQRQIASGVKGVATTVTIDVGDANDIHPKDKQTVGRRLANVALTRTYAMPQPLSPTLKSATHGDANVVVVTFDHAGRGLATRGETTRSFSLAGEDGVFHWATAAVDGDRATLASADVASPRVVRYAYADNPTPCVFGSDGDPAEPFEATVK